MVASNSKMVDFILLDLILLLTREDITQEQCANAQGRNHLTLRHVSVLDKPRPRVRKSDLTAVVKSVVTSKV